MKYTYILSRTITSISPQSTTCEQPAHNSISEETNVYWKMKIHLDDQLALKLLSTGLHPDDIQRKLWEKEYARQTKQYDPKTYQTWKLCNTCLAQQIHMHFWDYQNEISEMALITKMQRTGGKWWFFVRMPDEMPTITGPAKKDMSEHQILQKIHVQTPPTPPANWWTSI